MNNWQERRLFISYKRQLSILVGIRQARREWTLADLLSNSKNDAFFPTMTTVLSCSEKNKLSYSTKNSG